MPNKTWKKGKSVKVGRVVIKKPQTRKKLVDNIYEDYVSFYYDYGYLIRVYNLMEKHQTHSFLQISRCSIL